jgi:hypothetical protein
MHRMLHEPLPSTSNALLDYFLAALGGETYYPLGGNTGLPAGALESLDHNVVLAATPVSVRVFDEALVRSAEYRDTLLVRHGFYPETLDPVRVDVALRSTTGPILVPDLSLFRDLDGQLHLVPQHQDLFLTVGPDGIWVSLIAPFDRWTDRAAGLERAAADVVRACRKARAGQ